MTTNVLYASVALGGGTSSIETIAKYCGQPDDWSRFHRQPLEVTLPSTRPLRVMQDFRSNLAIGLQTAHDAKYRDHPVIPHLLEVERFLPTVDGIVLVIDSQRERIDGNTERVGILVRELASVGRSAGEVPLVFQLNKRDLPNAAPVEELRNELFWPGPCRYVESIAAGRLWRPRRFFWEPHVPPTMMPVTGVVEALDALLELIDKQNGSQPARRS